MSIFANLSGRQRVWLVVALLTATVIVVIGALRQNKVNMPLPSEFTVNMSIRQITNRLDFTGKGLARELGLSLDATKTESLKTLGVTQEELDHATKHILSHHETAMKYYVFAALALLGWVYLVRLGRPDGSPVTERESWYPRWPYIVVLVLAVAVCGFALGKTPNPMEGTVKVFKSFMGLYPSVAIKVAAFVFFTVLAVVGNKLICGWVCPFGALQELIYSN